MADDLLSVLTRFHRDVVLPDLERVVDERLEGIIQPLRDEMLSNFDAVFERLDRLESEYQVLRAAVDRLGERVERIETKIDKIALRTEVDELREKVLTLEQRLAELEANL